MSELERAVFSVLNKLVKWRTVFAGWQLGTRSDQDPECQAVRDHREVTILLRTDVNAFIQLLICKGVFTIEEFQEQLIKEAEILDRSYEEKFPGITTSDIGTHYTREAAKTMKNWRP
jgi:hypothetical protein